MSLQKLLCALFMITTMALAGCGGGGGGGSAPMAGMPENQQPPAPQPESRPSSPVSVPLNTMILGSGVNISAGGNAGNFTGTYQDQSGFFSCTSPGSARCVISSGVAREGTWIFTPSTQQGGGGMMETSQPPAQQPGGIPAAARNQPLAGQSVTQSSNGANGVTTDNISVTVSDAGNGRVNYTVANGQAWSLGSDDPETRTTANVQVQRRSGLNAKVVTAFEGIGQGTGGGEASVQRGIALQFLTDITGATDTDYLVWGSWFAAPENSSTHQDTIQGAFATGNDPFRQVNLATLTGTATYEGDADGGYFGPDTSARGGRSFSASATLVADFGGGSGLGTISGRIDNFRFLNDSGNFVARPRTTVTLTETDIGGADSGFFEGTSTGTYSDSTALSGQWGGQFYGNGDGSTQPGSVAGTFGAVSADDSRGLIGAFGAHKE